MARAGADLGLAGVAWLGSLGIVAALGWGELWPEDWWFPVGAAAVWIAATVGVGIAQNVPRLIRTTSRLPARPGRQVVPRRPRIRPPSEATAVVVAGPEHLDGAWVRVTAIAPWAIRVEAWDGEAWRVTATNLPLMVAAMPRTRPSSARRVAEPSAAS